MSIVAIIALVALAMPATIRNQDGGSDALYSAQVIVTGELKDVRRNGYVQTGHRPWDTADITVRECLLGATESGTIRVAWPSTFSSATRTSGIGFELYKGDVVGLLLVEHEDGIYVPSRSVDGIIYEKSLDDFLPSLRSAVDCRRLREDSGYRHAIVQRTDLAELARKLGAATGIQFVRVYSTTHATCLEFVDATNATITLSFSFEDYRGLRLSRGDTQRYVTAKDPEYDAGLALAQYHLASADMNILGGQVAGFDAGYYPPPNGGDLRLCNYAAMLRALALPQRQ